MTVEELLHRMTSREMAGWLAFYKVHPFGRDYDDASRAVGHMMYANTNRDRKRRPQPFEVHDFMFFTKPPPGALEPPQLTADQREVMETLGGMLGTKAKD